jgi:hypothetical protein
MNTLTASEQTLLAQLLAPAVGVPETPSLKRTAFQFVLEYGWFYLPSPLQHEIELGPDEQGRSRSPTPAGCSGPGSP